jgi:hypothetical protein
MGYYTRHQLSIVESEKTTYEDVQNYINSDDDMEYALGDSFGEDEEPHKWYTHEEDMRRMSKEFPDIIFLLEGEGEESGDIWKEYYKNGKIQRCQARLVFEEFNENKLT